MNTDRGRRALVRGAAINIALVTAVLLLAQQIAGKAIRDTLFLSQFPVTDLPKAMAAAALLSIVAVLLTSRLMVRYGPMRVVPFGFAIGSCLFLGEWLAIGRGMDDVVVMVVYLHTSVLGAILVSGFWSVLNERFDPYTAKQAFGSIIAASTLGGVLGAVIAQEVASISSVDQLLLVLAVISLVTLVLLRGIGAAGGSPAGDSGQEDSGSPGFGHGFKVIAGSSYLRWVALLVLVVAMVSTLLDYVVKVEAAAVLDDKDALIGFFSRFYGAVGFITFLIQPILGKRVLQRFGLGAAMAVLPLMVLLTGAGAALFTRLSTVVLAKGGEMVLSNSLFRSGFELLYTPVPAADKRGAKTLLDVGAQRLGDVLGSGLIMLLLTFIPVLPVPLVLGLAMVAASLALYAISRLHRGYVEQLGSNLRKGVVSVELDEVVDFTTRQTLAESRAAIDRSSLLSQIEALQQHRAEQQVADDTAETGTTGTAPVSLVEGGPLLQACAVLESGDPDAIRRQLASGPLDIRLVPQVLELLGSEELHEAALDTLQPLAARTLGQMVDLLLDPVVADDIRRRLPRLISMADSQRAVSALMAGLSDPRFEVRYFSARALSRMVSHNERLSVDKDMILEVVRREVSVSQQVWCGGRRRSALLDHSLAESMVGRAVPMGGNHSLEHVFTLLGLVLERHVLQLSMHAVQSRDRQMRGTALEYLENVLPDDIRRGLWGHLQRVVDGEPDVAVSDNNKR